MHNRYSELSLDGPTPVQMVRALPTIRRSPLPFLAESVRRYGDAVAFPVPTMPVLLINHPDDVARVLLDNAGAWSKATVQYGSLALVTGTGLLTADDPPWKQRRAVLQPAFRHNAFPRFAQISADSAVQLRTRWLASPGGTIDVEAAVMTTMIHVVGRTLFRDDLADVAEAVVEAVDEALRVVIARAQSPLPPLLMPRSAAALARSRAVLDTAVATVVERRRAATAQTPGSPDDATDDVLGLLLKAADDGLIAPVAVRDEVVTMVIAGHETVASALTWALHLLSRHPAQQDAVAAELDAVLGPAGGPEGRNPTWEDLPKLRRTRAVLDETLRLYPPAWVITRRSTAADRLAGVDVPAGTVAIISPWLVHRRPDTFADPERFDPDRFLAAADGGAVRVGSLSRPTGRYLPFGVGPRLCIGREVALIEGTLVLATLLHGHRVRPLRRAVEAQPLVTLRARGGLPLLLEARAPTSPSSTISIHS